ncbi:MAG: DUF5719 family protein [Acidobacteriota bacterium]
MLNRFEIPDRLCVLAVLSILLVSVGLAAESPAGSRPSVLPERSPGDSFFAVGRRAPASVSRDGFRLDPEQILSIPFSAEDIQPLQDQECPSCSPNRKWLVGVDKRVEATFELDQALSRRTEELLRLDTGLLRRTEDGSLALTNGVELPGAPAVRLHFDGFRLPPGWALQLYTPDGDSRGPYTGAGPNHTGEFWSHVMKGPRVYLELHAPAPADDESAQTVSFRLSEVAFVDVPFADSRPDFSGGPLPAEIQPMLEPNAGCVEDAHCFDGLLPAIQDGSGNFVGLDEVLRGGVGVILFDEDGGHYLCSGGLLNDTVEGSFIPYFLTAHHCISTVAGALSSEVFWQYQTSGCGQPYPSLYAFPSSLGANLLASSDATDFTLLLLSEAPPDGSYFLGWTENDLSHAGGTELYRFSHPLGSPQSFSKHIISAIPTPGVCGPLPQGRFIYSKDAIGAVEGGSSGSVAVLSSGQVVGQLFGACGANIGDVCDADSNSTIDGNLAESFDQVAQWLDPVQEESAGVYPPVFSPNGDLLRDTVRFYLSLSQTSVVTVDVLDSAGQWTDRLVDAQTLPAGSHQFDWDGMRADGTPADDGMYRFHAWGPGLPDRFADFGLNNSIPHTAKSWFLAEGSTVGFEAYVLIQNPNDADNPVTVTFFEQNGSTHVHHETVPPRTRTTVAIHGEVPDVYSVSTRVEAQSPIVVERAMYTPGQEAAHNSPGVIQLASHWYFPGNRTFQRDESFILVVNPSSSTAQLTVRFFTADQEPRVEHFTVGATSRYTIPVHAYFSQEYVSVAVDSSLPVAAEKAFYFGNRDGASASIGAVSPSLTWFFADGDTNEAQTSLHILNPGDSDAAVTVDYLLEQGSVITRTHEVAARRRLLLNAIDEIGSGRRFALRIRSSKPVVAERWMFSGDDMGGTIGSPTTALAWDLAEGFTAFGFETWIMVSNPGSSAANVSVQFQQQNSQNVNLDYVIAPFSRLTVYANDFVDPTSVSTRVSSDVPIVAERTVKLRNRQGMHQSMGVIE